VTAAWQTNRARTKAIVEQNPVEVKTNEEAAACSHVPRERQKLQ